MPDPTKSIVYPQDVRDGLINENAEQDQRMCIVFSPFKRKYNIILDECIKPAAKKMSLWVYRVDNSKTSGYIINDVLRGLFIAGQVIVDITEYNPNVMYELGLAHCYKRIHEVIILKQGKFDLPFDISPIRVMKYSSTKKGKETLKKGLGKCFEDIIGIRSQNFSDVKRRS
jgi:hypothetical protein